MMEDTGELGLPQHHVRHNLCVTRPKYREGRKLKAVKVYTVAQESKYLLVQGVPTVSTSEDLIKRFALYGVVEEYRHLDEYPSEEFTDVYWIRFQKIQAARMAKRKLDNYNFYGGVLHVFYGPEFETVEECRDKLSDRRKAIALRTMHKKNTHSVDKTDQSVKHESATSRFEPRIEEPLKLTQGQGGSRNPPSQPSQSSMQFLPYPKPPPLQAPHTTPPPSTYRLPHASHGYSYTEPPGGQIRSPFSSDDTYLGSKILFTDDKPKTKTYETITIENCDSKEKETVIKQPEIKKLDKNSLVIRDIKKVVITKPKFVPRQVVKNTKKDTQINKAEKIPPKVDPLINEIRRNAVILGKVAGPSLPRQPDLHARQDDGNDEAKIDSSIQETVVSIRNKIKPLVPSVVTLKAKKRKLNDKSESTGTNNHCK